MERFSVLLKDPHIRLRAMYVLVFALGVFFSVLILAYSQHVLEGSRQLVRHDLPLLARISDLKLEYARQEATLYDYQATGDRRRMEQDYEASARRAAELLRVIEQDYGAVEPIPSIRASTSRLDSLARGMQVGFPAAPAASDMMQPILLRVTEIVRELHAELDVLARLIEGRITVRANERQETVANMAQLAILFSMAIFLIAMFVGYYINMYLRENAERRRLAVFAERNPNPVLRLAPNGDVIYANAAATELARRMGGGQTARALLPADLTERLTALRGPAQRYEVWQYEREARSLECGIHFLPDLETFHAYIADVTERRLSEEKLVFQAYHHPLTGLPNRRMFLEVADQALLAPEEGGGAAAVLIIAVDRFRVVIDTLGHDVGDQVLQAVAARLTLQLQEAHEIARSAGLYHFESDRFAIFMATPSSPQAPAHLAERLISSSAQPLYVAGREFFLSFSIGVAMYPADGKDASTLLKNADSALQGVQMQGGRGFRLYKPEMNAMAAHWLALENHLRHAIERNELRLHYQPEVEVRTGRIATLEALVRWQHPQWGLLRPHEFLRLAEESGMILLIGEWVLRTACAQNQAWRERGIEPTRIAVNISARQFHRQPLPQLVESVLSQTGMPADALEIEITESVAMEDIDATATMLRELKDMGVRVAIDDFGTGFSSLAYLRRFPIDKLKIDQSFVRQMARSDTDAAIVRAVVTLGHALSLRVSAEGVATAEQLARLRQFDCDEAQGEFFSVAIAAREMENFLRAPQRVAT